MNGDDEDLRMRQAEFLMQLYEVETGSKSESIEDLDNWLMSKSKEERARIATLMEAHLRSGQ